MNVEIGAEAVLFPEKEYINGIAVAVWILGTHFSGISIDCTTRKTIWSHQQTRRKKM
jgi:hypothetical protein